MVAGAFPCPCNDFYCVARARYLLCHARLDGSLPAKSGGCCEYDPIEDYGYSKMSQLIFSDELSKRLTGSSVVSVAVHPGVIVQGSGIIKESCCLKHTTPCLVPTMRLMLKTPAQGASTTVYAALADEVESGMYYVNCNKSQTCSHVAKGKYNVQLWDKSAAIIEAKIGTKVPHGNSAPTTTLIHRGGNDNDNSALSDSLSDNLA